MDFDKKFCVSPFRRITRSPNGNVKTCCYHRGMTNTYDTLSEAFYSDEMDDLRNKMISGEYIKDCDECYSLEKNGQISQRILINNEHRHLIDDLNDITPTITDLEFTVDNKCNFSCVTCNPNFSSSWQNIIEKNSDMVSYFYEEKFIDRSTPKALNDIDFSQLKCLTLSGGEPTINQYYDKNFFELLKKNIDCNKFTFSMNTNCSKFPHKHWMNFLSEVKNVLIVISLDGVGDVGEWVRKGLDMKIFEKNLIRWLNFFGKKENKIFDIVKNGVWVNFVLTNFNVYNLYETFQYLKKYELDQYILLSSCNDPNFLGIQFLPREIKDEILNEIKFFNSNHEKFIIETLNSADYNSDVCRDFIKYVRFQNFLDKIPKECLKIYKRLLEYDKTLAN